MRVSYRRGGERIRLAGHTQSQSVKKLLSTRIAPWLRDSLPFVYNEQGELLAVGDVLTSQALRQHAAGKRLHPDLAITNPERHL